MTFSPNINRQTGKVIPRRQIEDEGCWTRVEDPIDGWMWTRKGYKLKDADLRRKGITNWLSLGEEMQWKFADEIDRERVEKLRDDISKRVQEAKKKWQTEHGTN